MRTHEDLRAAAHSAESSSDSESEELSESEEEEPEPDPSCSSCSSSSSSSSSSLLLAAQNLDACVQSTKGASNSRAAPRVSIQTIAPCCCLFWNAAAGNRFPSCIRMELSKMLEGLRIRLGVGGGSRRALGLLLIFATAAIWIVTSFISGSLVSSDDQHKASVHPFLLTYLATSLFTLYIPLLHLHAWITEVLESGRRKRSTDR